MPDFVRRCAVGLVFTAFLVPASASGQSGQSGQAPPTAPPAASDGVVKRLSIDEAVTLALEQNLSLQVLRLQPQVWLLILQLRRVPHVPR